MFKSMVALLIFGAVASGAQAASASQAILQNVNDLYKGVAGDIAAAAKQMPADAYDYRPTSEVRSFGQIVAHLAGSQFLYCAQAKGARFDRALIARLEPVRRYAEAPIGAPVADPPGKEALVALLDDGIAYCVGVYDGMTDAAAVETISVAGASVIRGRSVLENLAHNNLHYGNLVTYLRLKGLTPPSTQRRSH